MIRMVDSKTETVSFLQVSTSRSSREAWRWIVHPSRRVLPFKAHPCHISLCLIDAGMLPHEMEGVDGVNDGGPHAAEFVVWLPRQGAKLIVAPC